MAYTKSEIIDHTEVNTVMNENELLKFIYRYANL